MLQSLINFAKPCTICMRCRQYLFSQFLTIRPISLRTSSLHTKSTKQSADTEESSTASFKTTDQNNQRLFRKRLRKKFLIVSSLSGVILSAYLLYCETVDRLEKERILRKMRDETPIGGSWDLVDHHGKARSHEEFLGKWLLIYFGYCNCPDICPEELEKLAEVTEILDQMELPGGKIVDPLFITVDPKRDTVERVAQYVAEFSQRFLGLTGSLEQIDAVKRRYRVYGGFGPTEEDGNYIVDHTIVIYLINPAGKFVDYFGRARTAEQLVKGVVEKAEIFEREQSKLFPYIRTAEIVAEIMGDTIRRFYCLLTGTAYQSRRSDISLLEGKSMDPEKIRAGIERIGQRSE